MAKTKKGMVHPSPGQHRFLRSDAAATFDEFFKRFLKATKSRKAYTDWVAWEMLQAEVESQRLGIMPGKVDTDSNPSLYAAVAAIQAYIASEQAKTKAGAKRAKQESKAEEGRAAPKQVA